MDCVWGYFQLALSEQDSFKTTFLLPQGRFRYLRAPMGLSASSDEWCRRSDIVVESLPFAKKIVDDIIVWAPSLETLQSNLRCVLDKCRQNNITISERKLELGSTVRFAGHIVSDAGIRPDPERLASLANFPRPKDTSSLNSLLGLVAQLTDFNPDVAHLTANLRGLTSKKVAWNWLPEHEEEFLRLKKTLTSDTVIQPYDMAKQTFLLTDASRLNGLGYALMQKGENGKLHMDQCGSCS